MGNTSEAPVLVDQIIKTTLSNLKANTLFQSNTCDKITALYQDGGLANVDQLLAVLQDEDILDEAN